MCEVFIGREKELADLNGLYAQDKFQLFILYDCRQNSKGELPILFTRVGRWWGTNPATHGQEEIDLVANDGKDYIFGECKWRNDKLDLSVLCGLKAKADIFSRSRNNTYYILFSKSGFTEAVINEAESDSSVILVDLHKIMSF